MSVLDERYQRVRLRASMLLAAFAGVRQGARTLLHAPALRALRSRLAPTLRTSRARLYIAVTLAAIVMASLFTPLVRAQFGAMFEPRSEQTPGSLFNVAAQTMPIRERLALHVQGNLLVTRTGQSVLLHGVNRDGSDFLCADGAGIFGGPTGLDAIAALLTWHINAVRIPLNEACWLGVGGVAPQFAGAAYQHAVAAYVQALTGQGIYVILDLHKSAPGNYADTHTLLPVPDADHSITFWREVATQYRDNGMVLFDLFNEPHSITWQCLRDGGACSGASAAKIGIGRYAAAGMQTLVDTVRSAGARNVLLVSGLHWSNDLSQWLAYEPHDSLHNIAASWHVYTRQSPCADVACYTRELAPVAAQVPLVAGEFGADENGVSCDPQAEDAVGQMLNWFDQHQASYMAFTWNVGKPSCGSLALINDYAGDPHAPNGTLYRAHLLALAATPAPVSPPHGRAP